MDRTTPMVLSRFDERAKKRGGARRLLACVDAAVAVTGAVPAECAEPVSVWQELSGTSTTLQTVVGSVATDTASVVSEVAVPAVVEAR